MPIGNPRDGFFYPTLTLMMDSYKPSLLTIVMSTKISRAGPYGPRRDKTCL